MSISYEQQILNLDLHGVKHADVEIYVEDFVLSNQNELPLVIICGNSEKMISIVNKALKKIDVNFEETRYGRIRVISLDA